MKTKAIPCFFFALFFVAISLIQGCGGSNPENTPVNTVEPGPQRYIYVSEKIGHSERPQDGFFSLRSFQDKIFAGAFGYREKGSMLYSYSPKSGWEKVKPGITGVTESIGAMEKFKGALFANTEDRGKIFISFDGKNWGHVHKELAIGCSLKTFERLDGEKHLYASLVGRGSENFTPGKILRTKNGFQWEVVLNTQHESMYIREIDTYDGEIYAFAVSNGKSYMFVSNTGNLGDWKRYPINPRIFRAQAINGNFWLVSSAKHSQDGFSGIWRYNHQDGLVNVYRELGKYTHFSEIIACYGKIFALASKGWKKNSNDFSKKAALFISADNGNTWEKIIEFPENGAWAMEVYRNELYVATCRMNHGGGLYKIKQITTK